MLFRSWSWTLGAAGAAGTGERITRSIPARALRRVLSARGSRISPPSSRRQSQRAPLAVRAVHYITPIIYEGEVSDDDRGRPHRNCHHFARGVITDLNLTVPLSRPAPPGRSVVWRPT